MLGNTRERYGAIAMLLHWAMAALMIGLLGLGLYMAGLPDSDYKWGWYDLHKSLGVSVLALAVVRLAWRAANPVPAIPEGTSPIEKLLGRAVHLLLYASMLILPISGYVDSSAGGYHISWFGLLELPMLIPENGALFALATAIHKWTGYALIAVLGLHVAAALKHHFVRKDDVLRRMLPGG